MKTKLIMIPVGNINFIYLRQENVKDIRTLLALASCVDVLDKLFTIDGYWLP